MDSKGNDALLKTTKVTEWSIDYGGYIPLAFGGLLLLGCAVAYVIAVSRGNVEAILPLISDAAGSPPQNGLFGTLVCLGGMFGVVFMIQRYMIVLEKNRQKSRLVNALNKLSLFVGIVSMLGITLVTGYPANFYRNRDVWLMDVGLPHMIGGITLFGLGLLYIALQCILTLFLNEKNKTMFSVRVLLLFICGAAFVYHMVTIPENFKGISHLYYLNSTDTVVNYTGILPYPPTMGNDLKLPIDTSGSYVPSAIAQWLFVVFFCLFFFTFYSEAQDYCVLIVIETHADKELEGLDDSKLDFRKLSLAVQNGSGVDPDPKKILRRDSTCQTVTDAFEKMSHKPEKKPVKSTKDMGTNGTNKIMLSAEVDAKLTKLLKASEKNEDNNGVQGANTTAKNGLSKPETKSPSQNGTSKPETKEHGQNGTSKPEIKMSTQNGTSISKDDVIGKATEKDDKEEEVRSAIEKIDVVVKDAEEADCKEDQKEKEDKDKTDEIQQTQPSNCPLSVQ